MFHITDEDQFMGLINQVAAEPIDEEPYSLVRDPKPVVETVCSFDGVQINLESWTKGDGVSTNSEKVGKAKTAPDPKLTKAAPKSVNEKKEDGKIVENDAVADKKKKDQIVEVNADAEVKAKTPDDAGKGSSFDTVAKSAAKSNEGDAKSNKKFAAGCDKQKKVDLFKDGVKKLGVDAETKSKVENFLKDFDEISKSFTAKTESVDAQMEGLWDNIKQGAKNVAKKAAGWVGNKMANAGQGLKNFSQSGNESAKDDKTTGVKTTEAKPSSDAPAEEKKPADDTLTIKFSNSSKVTLSAPIDKYEEPVRTIQEVSGNALLEKYKGNECWVREDPENGKKAKISINIDGKWKLWTSGSTVTSVFNGSEEPAEEPNPETSVEETKASDAPVEETKASDTPVEETKASDASAEETKTSDASAEETKTSDAPVEEPKASDASAEEQQGESRQIDHQVENPDKERSLNEEIKATENAPNQLMTFKKTNTDGSTRVRRLIVKQLPDHMHNSYVIIDSEPESVLKAGNVLVQTNKDNNTFSVYNSKDEFSTAAFTNAKPKYYKVNSFTLKNVKADSLANLPKPKARRKLNTQSKLVKENEPSASNVNQSEQKSHTKDETVSQVKTDKNGQVSMDLK